LTQLPPSSDVSAVLKRADLRANLLVAADSHSGFLGLPFLKLAGNPITRLNMCCGEYHADRFLELMRTFPLLVYLNISFITTTLGIRQTAIDVAAVLPVGLEVLDCSSSESVVFYWTWDLSGWTNLTTLIMYGNSLTNVGDLSGLAQVTHLNLGVNQLTDVGNLSNLTKLTTLMLLKNQLNDVGDLSVLTEVTRLDLRDNQLTNVGDLSNLTRMTTLGLDENQLTNVGDLSGLTKMTILSLSDNQLTNVGDLSGLTALTYLSLGSNQLSDVGDLSLLMRLSKRSTQPNPWTRDYGPDF
jgi:hypothetical protein